MQINKSIIKLYCLLSVCNLQTVTPSQMISENTEDDQTNRRKTSGIFLKYLSGGKYNKSTQEVNSTLRWGRSFTF